ncbi:MAG: indolepyruvate ferredoxin oxidoreductase subunit beta [Candidatus Thermoplasmatota archaeon]|jgi:indolepyruvate ferredoxin oxidoreductase beta subunit|nr:indolepyruvate ferredoxin oxidoreductase subunit beta [Candidatus Thermoplasmatota archaeon]
MKTSIVLTGVGGQGVITAANILGKAAVKVGFNVYVSEIHGMAQRGGTVNCTVRIGDVSTALIANGTADVILSTEPVETLRYIKYSNKNTKIITDITPVIPFTVSTGMEEYPDLDKIFEELKKYGKLYKIDAVKIAKEAGSILTKNTVMLGALSGIDVLPFKEEILLEAILENIPNKYKEINKKAFKDGLKAIKQY